MSSVPAARRRCVPRSWSRLRAQITTSVARSMLVACLAILTACLPAAQSRHNELWRLPEGYAGWIYTRWDSPGCPALPLRDSYLLIDVPRQGALCTSSHLEE